MTHTHGEQFHHLACEVLLGLRLGIRPTVEPVQHRRVFGNVQQNVAKVPQRVLAQHLDLSAHAPRIFRRLGRHISRGIDRAAEASNLRVPRGKVVVPEECHLLLEWPIGVDHPKQPTLTGISDVRIGRERTLRRDPHVTRLLDLAVHIVRNRLKVQKRVNGVRYRHRAIGRELVRTRTEPRAAKQMFDLRISVSHACLVSLGRPNVLQQFPAKAPGDDR
jgi:hypothetical protein